MIKGIEGKTVMPSGPDVVVRDITLKNGYYSAMRGAINAY